jgi:hypothetical protein
MKPGDIDPRVRALIIGSCAVTILVAAKGMAALWGIVEWIEVPRYSATNWGTGRTPWFYESGLGLAVAAAIVLAWVPRFDVARLLRVAVVLPIIHLAAMLVAARLWSVLDHDLITKLDELEYSRASYRPDVTLPSLLVIAIAFAAMVVIAIAIKRRHGEWTHATVMLALSFLLLLGLWLPIVCRFSFTKGEQIGWLDEEIVRQISPTSFLRWAVIPPAIVAVGFVAVAFRAPAMLARYRLAIRWTTIALLSIATIVAVSLVPDAWDLYLESSYLVMTAIVLAVLALLLLTTASGLGSLVAHRKLRKLVQTTGVIATDDDGDAAHVEITSWLRGPRIFMRRFIVTTADGDVPITGAHLLATPPLATTALDVGQSTSALRAGDRVLIAGHRTKADGHPFRAIDATDVAFVGLERAHRYRLSDIALVVWRPAVAYLAIVIAVALPYLSILLT